MNGPIHGLAGFMRAPGFMLRNGMGWMFLVPVLLWVLFAYALFAVGNSMAAAFQAWGAHHLGLAVPAAERPGLPGFWDDVKALANGARDVVLWIVLKLAVLWTVVLAGKYVVLVLLSPLLSYASERAEEVLTGVGTPFSMVRWAKEVLRGAGMALRNGTLELGINILVWVPTLFIPVLAPLSALFLWLVSCWFYGFSMFDYLHERHGWGVRASLRAARQRQGTVLANGMAFNLLMKVPVLGMITAPLLGAVGAVLASTPPRPTRLPGEA